MAMGNVDPRSVKMRGSLLRIARLDSLSLALGGFVTQCGTHLVLSELRGLRTNLLRGTVMKPGIALGGRVLQLRRSVLVEDYVSSAVITHQLDRAIIADNIRGAVAIPAIVNGVIRAVMYGASRSAEVISERTADAAVTIVQNFAQDLAIEDEVNRRVERIREEFEHRRVVAARQLDATGTAEFNAELVAVAAAVNDETLRARLLHLSNRLIAERQPAERQPVNLSRREIDVIAQLAAGFTNAEIADRLAILTTTVKTHLASAMRKLGTRNRVETLAAARRAGVLP